MTMMMTLSARTRSGLWRRTGVLLALLWMGLSGMGVTPARAHGGEDHGDEAHAEALQPPGVLPRAATRTDEVELVAVLEPSRLLIYVDQAASNAPLTGARVEVEGLGATAAAPEVEPGVYALALAAAPAPGHHPLTVSVQARDVEDLLSAELDVPDPRPEEIDHDTLHDHLPAWTWVVAGSVVGALGALGLGAMRRRRDADRAHAA